jgi:hypothetical protein
MSPPAPTLSSPCAEVSAGTKIEPFHFSGCYSSVHKPAEAHHGPLAKPYPKCREGAAEKEGTGGDRGEKDGDEADTA